MGDTQFREKLRKLDAENRQRVNDLLKQEAIRKESMYKTNPNLEPNDFPESSEDLNDDATLTPQKAISNPSTKRKKKTIMITVFDDVVDWLEWKKDEGYSISAMCYKILKKAMENDVAWNDHKS